MKEKHSTHSEKYFRAFMKRKYNLEYPKGAFDKVKSGEIVLVVENHETNTRTYYHLKKIWITKLQLPYSNTPGTRIGKELLISNSPLPRKKIII